MSTSDIESSLTLEGAFWSRDFPNMNKNEMGQLKHDEIFLRVAKIGGKYTSARTATDMDGTLPH